MTATSSPEREIKSSKPSFLKRILGIAGVLIGSQIVGPQVAHTEQPNTDPNNTRNELMVKGVEEETKQIKYPAIQGQILLRKKDGTRVPYEGLVITLSEEGQPRQNPNETEYFPVAEAITDEEGNVIFEDLKTGKRYIMGIGREKDARRFQIVEPGGLDAHKPFTVTEETTLIPSGPTTLQEDGSPVEGISL